MSNPYRPISFAKAVPYGFLLVYEQVNQLAQVPSMLIQGSLSAQEARPIGPKGMFDIYEQARARDQEAEATPASPTTPPAVNTLWFLAVISVATGITNLLPIPALDGGHILFVLPEILLGRRVAPEHENMVHFIGFAALLRMFYIPRKYCKSDGPDSCERLLSAYPVPNVPFNPSSRLCWMIAPPSRPHICPATRICPLYVRS